MNKLFRSGLIYLLWPSIAFAQYECNPIIAETGVKNAYPHLSADGKKILYQSNRNGQWQLSVYSFETRQSTPLTEPEYNAHFGDWSPDEKQIAFVSDRDGNQEIYLMKSDGSQIKRLTNDEGMDIHPYFSPDGKYLLFNSDRGNGSLDIYRLSLDEMTLARLTDTPQDETCARYHPNMRHIVYLKNSVEQDDVYLLDMQTFLSVNVSNTPETRDGWPSFSGDGKFILFSEMTTSGFQLVKVPMSGGKSEALLPSLTNAIRVHQSRNGIIALNVDEGNTIAILLCDMK